MAVRVAEGINAIIAVFTAIAAASAGYAAYQSYRQTDLTRLALIRTEQLQSFEQFITVASKLCNSYDDMFLDSIWDFTNNDFKKDADLSQYQKEKMSNSPLILPSEPSDEVKQIHNYKNDMYFQALKLIEFDFNGLGASQVRSFIDDFEHLPHLTYFPTDAKDVVDQMRIVQRSFISTRNACQRSLILLVKAYAPIIGFSQ